MARFENKRRLLASYLSMLMGLSIVNRESASELQNLCDKVNISIASLKGLDRIPENLWNDTLVHLTVQKLDAATRKAWNLHTTAVDTPPTYESLNEFLSFRIRALEECSPSSLAKPKMSEFLTRSRCDRVCQYIVSLPVMQVPSLLDLVSRFQLKES